MTKILKPLGFDIYLYKLTMHTGTVKTIAVAPIREDEITSQMEAFAFRKVFVWSIDILYF